MPACLSVCLPACLSVRPSVCPSVRLCFVFLSIQTSVYSFVSHLSVCPPVCLSVCLSVRPTDCSTVYVCVSSFCQSRPLVSISLPPTCLFVCLPACLPACLSVCMSIRLSIRPSVSLSLCVSSFCLSRQTFYFSVSYPSYTPSPDETAENEAMRDDCEYTKGRNFPRARGQGPVLGLCLTHLSPNHLSVSLLSVCLSVCLRHVFLSI